MNRTALIEAMAQSIAVGWDRVVAGPGERKVAERALTAIEAMAVVVPREATLEMTIAYEQATTPEGGHLDYDARCPFSERGYAAMIAASPFAKEPSDGQ
jgi:hypothetical protein